MLARSWGIPSAYIRGAAELFGSLEGKYVKLEVSPSGYRLAPADPEQVSRRNLQLIKRAESITPRADLGYRRLTDLNHQRSRDSEKFGAKSANLGEIINRRIPGIAVPRGFTIPFYYYDQFLRRNGLEDRIEAALEEDRFAHDPKYRRQKLTEIRGWIQAGQHDPWLRRAVLTRINRQYAGKSLFVRSSTNAEDLHDFSGAGLYTTVPNVRTSEQLLEAIKTVWASVWNYEAYEARESYGMNHMGVYMAVIIQEGIEADAAGVAITRDPFNPANRSAVYINAKRGLGIRVVEGRRIPEQLLYDPGSDSIRLLVRSEDDTMLAFDEKGGIREIKMEGRRTVLTDLMVKALSRASLQIERAFGGVAQDIEWLYKGNKLYIVQSRPYVAQQPL
jgi:phosphoenolpyruvate synthase/pyruvate phosphate dikinase